MKIIIFSENKVQFCYACVFFKFDGQLWQLMSFYLFPVQML